MQAKCWPQWHIPRPRPVSLHWFLTICRGSQKMLPCSRQCKGTALVAHVFWFQLLKLMCDVSFWPCGSCVMWTYLVVDVQNIFFGHAWFMWHVACWFSSDVFGRRRMWFPYKHDLFCTSTLPQEIGFMSQFWRALTL
jgi:hypothetical protein